MRRLLIIVIFLYVVWRILGIIGRRLRGVDPRERVARRPAQGAAKPGPPGKAMRLVACSRCGTLVPEDRALRGPRGELYCAVSCLESAGPETELRDDGGRLPPPA